MLIRPYGTQLGIVYADWTLVIVFYPFCLSSDPTYKLTNTHKHVDVNTRMLRGPTHTSRSVLLASCLKYAVFFVCVCEPVKKSMGGGSKEGV